MKIISGINVELPSQVFLPKIKILNQFWGSGAVHKGTGILLDKPHLLEDIYLNTARTSADQQKSHIINKKHFHSELEIPFEFI